MFKRFRKGESPFVLSVVSGDVDSAQLLAHVKAFTEESAENYGLLELVDCRAVSNADQLTVRGCIDASKIEMACPRSAKRKLAIVVPNQLLFGLARAYATISCDSRADTTVCYSIEEALEWLGAEDPIEDLLQFIDSHSE